MSDEPTERDVEALVGVLAEPMSQPSFYRIEVARAVLASDWYAERIAEAEQRGREGNIHHAMCYVFGSKALAERIAQARREGAAEVTARIDALAEEWERNARARGDTGHDTSAHAAADLRAALRGDA